jgi:hypothetical protein
VNRRIAVLLFAGAGLCSYSLSAGAAEPQLDSEYQLEETPPLPPGIGPEPVNISCVYAYAWGLPDGTKVISAYGDFTLKRGEDRLRSRDAVVWFRPNTWEKTTYLDFEVFLWQDAEVLQPAGTVESGPALMVTLASAGQLRLSADSHTLQSDKTSTLYQRAATVRATMRPGAATTAPTAPVQTRVGAATTQPLVSARPPREVDYSGRELTSEVVNGQRVVIVIGDVRVSLHEGVSAEAMELRADAAVLYLSEAASREAFSEMSLSEGRSARATTREAEAVEPPSAAEEPKLTGRERPDRMAARQYVTSAYLEGDVVLTRGTRMIRGPRMYYDFEADRALALDVVMRAFAPGREVPIYVRADEVRQLSASEYFARRAKLTTSDFYTPHVALGSTKAYITDRTPRNDRGEIIGIQAGTYKAYDTTLQVEGVPILYWPVARGDFSEDTMAFKSVRTGYNNNFGALLETRWYLFNLLGLQQPPGYDATLALDYYSEKGPGIGIDADYVRENYYGLFRSYYIHDTGEDENLGPLRDGPPSTENRGRVLWRHRQYLPQDWQLVLELSYISDRNFLEAYYRNEFENAKTQETVIYLLKRKANWEFQTLFNWRLNNWIALTEHYPDVIFSLIGEPLADFVTLYSEQRVSAVRYLNDNDRVFVGQDARYDNTGNTDTVARGDARQELRFPLPELGTLKITPYLAGRASAWSDSPQDGGSRGRVFGAAGLNGNTYFQKTYDNVESEMLNVHRLKHIIKPDIGLWIAGDNVPSDDLSPFDQGVETIDGFSGVTLGLRQRWQTKRGGPGRWRTVDWITWDIEVGFFDHPRPTDVTHGDYIFARPEDSISSNFLLTDFTWRVSETTALMYSGVYDLNPKQMGTSSISVNVERDPRLAYFFGWRYIHDTDNSLIGFGANYRLNEKYIFAFREYYDIELDRNYSTELSLVRRWPRWYTAVTFDIDEAIDQWSIALAIWPEGATNIGLGSKRMTTVAESVGIRP